MVTSHSWQRQKTTTMENASPMIDHSTSANQVPLITGTGTYQHAVQTLQMPQVPRHLRRCHQCYRRHCAFDCPHCQGLRQHHAELFQDSHDAMRSLRSHMACGTRTRSPFVLVCWPLSMRLRQHDRFVLIGLCWLYGRSDFPPPPDFFQPERCSENNQSSS